VTARTQVAGGLTPRHLAVLTLLTLVWGINWPVMKVGVTAFPPLTFRTISMWLGLPVLFLVLRLLRVPLAVPRVHWRELGSLTVTNMLVWHVVAITSLQALSSGRAAILGYTMPVFSALWGRAAYGERLLPRQIAGVAAALAGAALLLWHEFAGIAGSPLAALGMLLAAAVWAVGTQRMRRTGMVVPTLAVAFWMTVVTTVVMTILAVVVERPAWNAPSTTTWAAIVFNAVAVFGYAQPAWLYLARTLPPIASTLSVMMIPVLGVVAGAVWLGERLYWQDGAAVCLLVAAIASVLLPARVPATPAS
jgi:drug/metabolite transporter (DMT)-like permease